MENVAISTRNHTNKKGNKENAQPAYGSKSFIRNDKPSVTPFQLKSNKIDDTLEEHGPLKAKVDTKSTSGEAPQKVKPLQKTGTAAADVKPRQTHSRAYLSHQAVRHNKIVAEAPKPPAAVPSSKSAPGMYKGKVVQSKIGSIWKSTTSINELDTKPSAPKTQGQRVGNITKCRSKSVADLPGYSMQKPVPTSSKSALDRHAQVSKPALFSRPPAGFRSARPPARTAPATLTSTSSRNTKVAPTKGTSTQNSKISVTDKKVNKPPVSSTLSQYRFNMETAEERRAKLAEWMASKGKTFKRPARVTAELSKTKVSAKPAADLKPKNQPAAQSKPEPRLEHKLDSAAHCADKQGAAPTHDRTPLVMNTTLDLLADSDAGLPGDPQGSVDDIVLNLCDALDAMGTPSKCHEPSLVTDVSSDSEMEDSQPEEELNKGTPEDVSKQPKVEQVKHQVEESDGVETEEEVESDDVQCVTENTPEREGASMIKYSVKTTPYLQSVKKTIQEETSKSRSKKKNNIKDLKFLTPVRRSCRIERKSSRLPAMLMDPDPCVSSLAELVMLDGDSNAYIYRKNHALLEDLPDQPRL
ncbi:cytoskeleton-associated protein 2 [Notothenia coriiceps]|uniref:Cytoskeleton-associated protein 2 n=1 Tax=Notothenia coriiceps TaxID=8208 RepID=A0A6I9MWE1_9TELE|nr:PREDICTED: cytoskeleton-associated protein 2-like [Notothenia coriiceps]